MISTTVAGNLGKDAELRHTPNGDSVCSFSVASNSKRGDKDVTTWVRCSLWGKRGTALMQYLTKGTRVAVSGSLSLREYDKDGEARTSLELNVQDVALLGGGSAEKSERSAPPKGRPADRGDAYEDPTDDLPF
jgi:single-strand DNA-binding protein